MAFSEVYQGLFRVSLELTCHHACAKIRLQTTLTLSSNDLLTRRYCVSLMTDIPEKKKHARKATSAAKESAKKWNRTYLSLSFSAPPDLEGPMNDRAVAKGYRSRSEYLCDLVEEDLRKAGLLKGPVDRPKLARVGHGSRSSKSNDAKK